LALGLIALFLLPLWLIFSSLSSLFSLSLSLSLPSLYVLLAGESGLWSWGNGSGGKLGHGDIKDRYEPTLVQKLAYKSILQVEAGTFHSMAIVTYPPVLDGGYLYTWGSGFYGQLAQGATTVKSEPTIVEYFVLSHLMIKQVSAGAHHCLALTKENELFSWGNNLHGALGR
jgi:alpha-tubulin suppressor-like RCC1 family protein